MRVVVLFCLLLLVLVLLLVFLGAKKEATSSACPTAFVRIDWKEGEIKEGGGRGGGAAAGKAVPSLRAGAAEAMALFRLLATGVSSSCSKTPGAPFVIRVRFFFGVGDSSTFFFADFFGLASSTSAEAGSWMNRAMAGRKYCENFAHRMGPMP